MNRAEATHSPAGASSLASKNKPEPQKETPTPEQTKFNNPEAPMPSWPGPGDTGPYKSPVDFDNVNASVDQMSVDMNTIASSTDKMRQAVFAENVNGKRPSLRERCFMEATNHFGRGFWLCGL